MSKPKILEQIENAGGAFIATYGTTTFAEVKAAYEAGKVLQCIDTTATSARPIASLLLARPNVAFVFGNFNKTYQITSKNVWQTQESPIVKKSGSTMTGSLVAYNPTAINSNSEIHNTIISTAEPTASDGNIGDIWIQYEGE